VRDLVDLLRDHIDLAEPYFSIHVGCE
jgi:hypothetical protein